MTAPIASGRASRSYLATLLVVAVIGGAFTATGLTLARLSREGTAGFSTEAAAMVVLTVPALILLIEIGAAGRPLRNWPGQLGDVRSLPRRLVELSVFGSGTLRGATAFHPDAMDIARVRLLQDDALAKSGPGVDASLLDSSTVTDLTLEVEEIEVPANVHSLWELSEELTGRGQRYREIVDVNLHHQHEVVPGREFEESDLEIEPGWRLLIPRSFGRGRSDG